LLKLGVTGQRLTDGITATDDRDTQSLNHAGMAGLRVAGDAEIPNFFLAHATSRFMQ
jgi:hypothetical protein